MEIPGRFWKLVRRDVNRNADSQQRCQKKRDVSPCPLNDLHPTNDRKNELTRVPAHGDYSIKDTVSNYRMQAEIFNKLAQNMLTRASRMPSDKKGASNNDNLLDSLTGCEKARLETNILNAKTANDNADDLSKYALALKQLGDQRNKVITQHAFINKVIMSNKVTMKADGTLRENHATKLKELEDTTDHVVDIRADLDDALNDYMTGHGIDYDPPTTERMQSQCLHINYKH